MPLVDSIGISEELTACLCSPLSSPPNVILSFRPRHSLVKECVRRIDVTGAYCVACEVFIKLP